MSNLNLQELSSRHADPFLDVAPNQLNTQLSSLTRSPVPISLQVTDTKPNPERAGSPDSTSDLLSEYHFPLPPSRPPSRPSSRSAYSATQGSRPSSPFPPLYPPPLSTSSRQDISETTEKGWATTRSIHSSQHSRSEIDVQKITQLKPLPARPASPANENQSDETMKGKQHLFQFMRTDSGIGTDIAETARSISLVGRTGGGKGAPQVTTIESKSLLSPDKEEKEGKYGMKEKERQGIQPHHASTENKPETRPRLEVTTQYDGGPFHKQKLTPDQMIWLHKNYRGEATFLKAWGLHFTRDADREQGREILRVLMAAESQKGKEGLNRDDLEEKQSSPHGRLYQSASGDGAGLRVIQEATATNFVST
ncbi:hypothetical protein Hte_003161 [Hypoxylon texense]